jgi:hypothetical protein
MLFDVSGLPASEPGLSHTQPGDIEPLMLYGHLLFFSPLSLTTTGESGILRKRLFLLIFSVFETKNPMES